MRGLVCAPPAVAAHVPDRPLHGLYEPRDSREPAQGEVALDQVRKISLNEHPSSLTTPKPKPGTCFDVATATGGVIHFMAEVRATPPPAGPAPLTMAPTAHISGGGDRPTAGLQSPAAAQQWVQRLTRVWSHWSIPTAYGADGRPILPSAVRSRVQPGRLRREADVRSACHFFNLVASACQATTAVYDPSDDWAVHPLQPPASDEVGAFVELVWDGDFALGQPVRHCLNATLST